MSQVLKVIGTIIVIAVILVALFVLWRTRHRADSLAKSTRYSMLGTISLCSILPASLLLEQRLSVLPYAFLLLILLAGGIYFLRKARQLDR